MAKRTVAVLGLSVFGRETALGLAAAPDLDVVVFDYRREEIDAIAGLVPHEQQATALLDNVYESVSAIGTVGLSTGNTARLSAPGQLILIALMFTGRTGPLVIGASLIGRRRRALRTLPEEPVLVG